MPIDLGEVLRIASDYDGRKEAARKLETENFGGATEERVRYLASLKSGEAPKAFEALRPLVELVRELEEECRTLGERLCETEHDLTEALDKKEELEGRIAELTQENSNQKRVIQMLEYRVLALQGKPIPMEPRLPTCDALYHPRPTLQSNRSNAAKEAVQEAECPTLI